VMDTIERARRYLRKLPPSVSGSGGHDAAFKAASILVMGFALDDSDALALLSEWNVSCSPPWSDRELRHKIQSALGAGGERGSLLKKGVVKNSGVSKKKKRVKPDLPPAPEPARWPALDVDKLRAVVDSSGGKYHLFELSPVRNEIAVPPYWYLDQLFDPASLVCIGKSATSAKTAPLHTLREDVAKCQFIVPSPMSALKGKTLGGRESSRCLDNTGKRRFLVIECDFEAVDKQGNERPEGVLISENRTAGDLCASVLIHLASFAPLVMAVSSGGKSVHGWFLVGDQSEVKLEGFMRYAVQLGADKATWCRCQFVRMPEGIRSNGKRQEVLFFNPELLK